jgi:ferredoxin-thioredoxin reductase catalytic chain
MGEYPQEAQELHRKLKKEAEEAGYFLNPDLDFTMMLMEGLAANVKRYGYPLCPCRLGSGAKQADLDIICPCDYRDADLDDYGCCYCSLYVSKEVAEGKAEASSIPDRRPPERVGSTEPPPAQDAVPGADAVPQGRPRGGTAVPVWRCKVCGYLCARDKPPGVCPICKAGRERFEPFPL